MWRVHPLVEYTFTGVYRYSISVDNRFDNPIDNTIEYPDCIICSSFVTPHVLISHHTNFTDLISIFYKNSIIFYIIKCKRTDAHDFKIIIDWFYMDAQTYVLPELI